MSAEKLTTPTTTDNSLSLSIKQYGDSHFCLVFKESWLKQKNETYTSPDITNFLIAYELDTWSQDLHCDFTLKSCLHGGIKLSKNADADKYVYSGYGIEFGSRSLFSLTNFALGKNVIILELIWAHQCLLITKKKKDILILGKGPTQGLDDTKLTVKAQYSINFSKSNRKFCFFMKHEMKKEDVLCI